MLKQVAKVLGVWLCRRSRHGFHEDDFQKCQTALPESLVLEGFRARARKDNGLRALVLSVRMRIKIIMAHGPKQVKTAWTTWGVLLSARSFGKPRSTFPDREIQTKIISDCSRVQKVSVPFRNRHLGHFEWHAWYHLWHFEGHALQTQMQECLSVDWLRQGFNFPAGGAGGGVFLCWVSDLSGDRILQLRP